MLYSFIGFLTIISSIVVISARNPIHNLLALISVVLNIVILLILLEAEFLALTFVAVYLGAVTVLFLFVVMMLNIKGADLRSEFSRSLPISAFLGLCFLSFLYFIVFENTGVDEKALIFVVNYLDWKSILINISNLKVFGSVLYSYYAPLLLIIGVILLVALIGTVILTKTNYVLMDRKRNFIDQQISRNYENAVFLVNEKKVK
jgi:NADH-quinone oxidoreductase subunit J